MSRGPIHDLRRPSRANFSLVELLVVIAVLVVLFSLLLPALQSAVESSRRLACLNERRQNIIPINVFAEDHGDLVPHATNRDGDPEAMGPTVDSCPGANGDSRENGVRLNENSLVMPWGTLARNGYIPGPKTLFCSAFVRDSSNWNRDRFDEPRFASSWKSISTNTGFPAFRFECGVANYFWVPDGTACRQNVRLSHIAALWRTPEYSALLVSCANHESNDGTHNSHDFQGVNGAFYDGSGRWIGLDEVMADKWQAYSYVGGGGSIPRGYLYNHYPRGGYCNMQPWARKFATPIRPR